MNIKNLLITILIVSSFSFTSIKIHNGFSLENNLYITTFGYLANLGSNELPGSGNIDIHLMSTPNDYVLKKFDNVTLDLNTPDTTALAEGIYNYHESADSLRIPYTLSEAYVIVNSKSKNDSEFLQAVSGQVVVKKEHNRYKIKYELLLENGLSLTGFYTGSMEKW